jgi:hypothetical protein
MKRLPGSVPGHHHAVRVVATPAPGAAKPQLDQRLVAAPGVHDRLQVRWRPVVARLLQVPAPEAAQAVGDSVRDRRAPVQGQARI